jgi:uncharacterized protein DUF4118
VKPGDESRVWAVAGGLGAMALGVALIPLRAHTSASNLAFIFLALTIVVAELGGRSAALVTAVVSAMSLNFFLTEPYLTLAITKADDVVAFVALAACGLIAAAFGRRRERLSEAAGRGHEELEILKRLSERLGDGTSLDQVLADLRQGFGLSAVALRDAQDRVVASAGSVPAARPETELTQDTLLPVDESRLRFGAKGFRLPEHGGRLALHTAPDALWLDVWEGGEDGWSLDESRTLAIAASILGFELSRRQSATAPRR